MEYYKQFQTHIDHNDLPQVVNLWQEYCLSEEIDPEEYIEILTAIKKAPMADSFGVYADQGLLLWEHMKPDAKKDTVFKLIFDIQTTNSPELAALALAYIHDKYKNDPLMDQKIKLVGLRDKVFFKGAIANFELLTHMKIGNFFLHTGGWGIGQLIEVSMLREQLTLEFDYIAGHKEVSFANAFKTLIPVTKDHFLARRFGDPEAFEVFAKQHPVETIHMLLRDLGPKTAAEIKEELCELVIPENEWQKWWQMTRTKLKKDTLIEAPESVRDSFRLRKDEISHEERLKKVLKSSPDLNSLIESVYSFIRDFPSAIKNQEFSQFLIGEISNILSTSEITASQEIQLLFILQDLNYPKANAVSQIVAKTPNLEEVAQQIHILSYKKRILVEIKNNCENWTGIFTNLLFLIDQNLLRDYLLDELLAAKKDKLVASKIEELLVSPEISPNTFLWYFQKIISDEDYPYSDQEGKDRFFESFFILLHRIEQNSAHKDLVKKMLNFLSAGRFANVRKLFQHESIEVVQEILLLSTKCQSLTDHDIKILHSLAEVVHPSLSQMRKGGDEEEAESIIWTTREGFAKVQERIEKIGTVEIVDVAREIEIARSHGDLRENSEFKFAQERRARLQSELKFLSSQIQSMRILTKEDIDTNQIGIGTIAELKDPQGKKITYTFLGPWDADPEHNILSIESKIGKDLKGLKVGDRCKVKDHDYSIASISSYL